MVEKASDLIKDPVVLEFLGLEEAPAYGVKIDGEMPTVGILLCDDKNDAVVELTLPEDANIYASKYQLYLPSREDLADQVAQARREIGGEGGQEQWVRYAEQARVEANGGFGREGGVCRRDQAPGEGSAGMRGAFGRRGVRDLVAVMCAPPVVQVIPPGPALGPNAAVLQEGMPNQLRPLRSAPADLRTEVRKGILGAGGLDHVWMTGMQRLPGDEFGAFLAQGREVDLIGHSGT